MKNPSNTGKEAKSKTPLISPNNAMTPLRKTKKRGKDDSSLTEMN
jgi:hypothetical protein